MKNINEIGPEKISEHEVIGTIKYILKHEDGGYPPARDSDRFQVYDLDENGTNKYIRRDDLIKRFIDTAQV